jgi:hypothetical protein
MKSQPRAALLALSALLGLAGCAGESPFTRHVSQCSDGGFPPGSQDFAHCMSGSTARAAETADERRERQRWLARLERERIAAEQRVRDEQGAVIGMRR